MTARALAARGLHVIATVRESPSVTDLAITSAQTRIVVRCVEHAAHRDARALTTMLTQGDFDCAFLVYAAEVQPSLSGEIESYPLSRIDELAASLARESAK